MRRQGLAILITNFILLEKV